MTGGEAQRARVLDAVLQGMDAWPAPGHGLTGLQHARAHRAAMSPQRRAELDAEWADAPALKESRHV